MYELGPRYQHGVSSQKTQAYDYLDPSFYFNQAKIQCIVSENV